MNDFIPNWAYLSKRVRQIKRDFKKDLNSIIIIRCEALTESAILKKESVFAREKLLFLLVHETVSDRLQILGNWGFYSQRPLQSRACRKKP